ncbi:heparan-alpha-glucosaminide N-acetyltransferase domain-containing protein [Corynebacterium glyciniphilum]|uniref:heparan-alpha-glucosaminide N-acetyltransferase domain-containing protein n=1 Tax=Corynebacterium glyciniphilum TaxID=1404244 RepID=UPI003DA147F6
MHPEREGANQRSVGHHVTATPAVPVNAPGRIQGIDLARALAILGMFAAHLTVTPPFQWNEPTTWSALVNGNSSVLFAALAGVSLALSTSGTDKATPPTGHTLTRARRLLTARAAIIWIIGLLLVGTGVPVNVILPAYGILFLVSTRLIAHQLSTLVTTAALTAITMPVLVSAINTAASDDIAAERTLATTLIGWYYPFPVWAAFLTTGIAAGRVLASARNHIIPAAGMVALGVPLAAIGHLLLGPIATHAEDNNGPWLLTTLHVEPHSSGIGEVIGSGGVALAAIGMCVLICLTPLRHLTWPLRAMGSMPLTAYTAHLLVWKLWALTQTIPSSASAQMLTEFRATEPFWPATLAILAGCALWNATIGKGPLEYLVGRAATILASVPNWRPADQSHHGRHRRTADHHTGSHTDDNRDSADPATS